MTIKEFITSYNEGKIKNLKETLEVKDYIPFAEKYEICASVLDACNDIDKKTGIVKIDSINRQITFIITMISAYTNLEFSLDENAEITSIDEYDMLEQNNLITPIVNLLDKEYAKCEEMLNTMQNDLLANNNTFHNLAGNMAKQLLDIIEPLGDIIKEKVSSFNLDLNQDNIDKFAKIFEGLNNQP